MLNAKNIKTTRPTKKLDDKMLGPFEITERVGSHAYRLDLPASFRIHDVFHVSMLEAHAKSQIENRHQPPPPPVENVADRHDTEYDVEKIVQSRHHRGTVQYRVQWTGYQHPDYIWRNWADLEGCRDLIREFHEDHPTAARHKLA